MLATLTINRMGSDSLLITALVGVLLAGPSAACGRSAAPAPAPSTEEARQFAIDADRQLLPLSNKVNRAQWVAATFITTDTEAISADANRELIASTTTLAKRSTRFDQSALDPNTARRLKLLKLASLPLPAPSDPAKQAELAQIGAALESMYGRGRYCPRAETGSEASPRDCLDINALTEIMAKSRNAAELVDAWKGWHSIAPPMKPKYQRFVGLANEGARELGATDLGALWRSNYEMPPDAFATEVERLWAQVKPLYDGLFTHVRASLVKQYGPTVVPHDGPIPAHLLGNMWAQQWGNVYDLMGVPSSGRGFDLNALLAAKKMDEREMVRFGERFFISLGFEPLPQTFWERSLFTKPQDRDVVCHASAWNIDNDEDLRIKMCIQRTGEDFITIHHELGHSIYQRAYRLQPFIFRGSAHDGVHEAIGDAIALSVTPEYLVKVGLLDRAQGAVGDLEFLMRMALDKVAFLPFGLVVDLWRWRVFSGEIPPEHYNAAWWELRQKYQNISAPVPRSEADFDPGAKYHVPANIPYARYFLAHILQFQFHRAMCRDAGYEGPLHRCSIYGNRAVGAKLARLLELGQSQPWPDALETLTGERQMDATALLDYFAPLRQWLSEESKEAQ